jgi:hypothetical protein
MKQDVLCIVSEAEGNRKWGIFLPEGANESRRGYSK